MSLQWSTASVLLKQLSCEQHIHRIGGQACEALAEAAICLVHGASVASAAVTAAGIVEGSGGVLLLVSKVVVPSWHGAGGGT